MRLVLIRHGESVWNMENRFTGWTDVELSPKGMEEAAEAGRILREKGFDFDICYTSYLKRAIHTLNIALDEMDRQWLPVVKSWKLNERHYGALQGLNKSETAEKYGEEQVRIWRRSFDVQPPVLDKEDERNPRRAAAYSRETEDMPLAESLKDTIARVVPYYNAEIKPQMESGRNVLIVAHGNSLRALVKYFENLSNEEIIGENIPTGTPLVYEFNENFEVADKYYLGDEAAIQAKMQSVANQGKAK